jgi:glycosyltransferase involved in cell wall biosynthesis
MPSVSVVIPVYNGARFLDEALASVFAQTYTDYDVVCVDDGSTDESVNIIARYGARVTLIRQRNAGGCAARNEGVRRTAGGYLAFLDQDDRWYPDKLARQVAALDAHPEAVLALCNSDRMNTEGLVVQVGATVRERPGLRTEPLGRLIGEDQLLSSAILVRRDAFVRAGMFDEQLHGFEDFDLAARLRQEGRFVFIEEPGMCYRINQGGQSQSGGLRIIRSRERFLLKMRELYRQDAEKQDLIRGMLADCYSDWGWSEIREGNRRAGRGRLRQSLGHDPLRFRTYSRLLRSLF